MSFKYLSGCLWLLGLALGCHGQAIMDTILSVNEAAGLNLKEGDIAIRPTTLGRREVHGKFKRNMVSGSNLWPKGDNGRVRVPVKLRSGSQTLNYWRQQRPRRNALSIGLAMQRKITNVASIFSNFSCIDFVYKTDADDKYIEFYKGDGCHANVKMYDNGKEISLGAGCGSAKTIAHELYHALGFYHEQSRPDRDNYLTIKLQNVKAGKEHNFDRQLTTDTHGYDYDRKSIMHYGKYSFSKNLLPTIVWTANTLKTLGGNKLTKGDIGKLNTLYDCPATFQRYPEVRTLEDSMEELDATDNIMENILDESVLKDIGKEHQ
ncbi:zinc metalloproteinase nas-15-like [Hydractinia symbiolongicarpus]|uniref:zinc metalloproteinase nas-15-like n=1 Tax=Hydractinia symbiolongicarpus TaxID=13093 RepID=UPI002550AE65|nr:zinc metalloproteinase nas-15-like [Hydractinia symbiolongicarpus]